MKYTFLVPSYKANFLKKALESILYQTYDNDNFNIIVSDDCSTENIEGIVKTFHDKRLIYRRNNNNIGGVNLVKHWNLLLDLCKSDYLIMASDDDIYNPHFLECIDKLITEYPKAFVYRARVQRINDEEEVIAKEDIFDKFQNKVEVLHSIFCGNYIGCIGNYVFKTQELKNRGGFINFPYAWFSDMASVINLLDEGQLNTCEILFNFRLSTINISNTIKNKKMDQQKLLATMEFDHWFSNIISKIIRTNSCILEQIYINEIISAFKHRVYTQCGDYSWSLNVLQKYKIIKKIRSNTFFSLLSFLKYFSIAIMNRMFRFIIK